MSKHVWVIGVDEETERYTPCRVTYKEAKGWQSKIYLTYADCLTECQQLNILHGKYNFT
jgi:hypothetical protein